MKPEITKCLAYTFLVLVCLVVDGNDVVNVTTNSTSSSPWLKSVTNPRVQQAGGCWNRPWVCFDGQIPPRRLCCMNRCVDIMADPNNCGFCEVRCPFTWQCCEGVCTDVNINPFHCGKCSNRCQLGRPCVFGMCGYAQPFTTPSLGLPVPRFPFPPGLPVRQPFSQGSEENNE